MRDLRKIIPIFKVIGCKMSTKTVCRSSWIWDYFPFFFVLLQLNFFFFLIRNFPSYTEATITTTKKKKNQDQRESLKMKSSFGFFLFIGFSRPLLSCSNIIKSCLVVHLQQTLRTQRWTRVKLKLVIITWYCN